MAVGLQPLYSRARSYRCQISQLANFYEGILLLYWTFVHMGALLGFNYHDVRTSVIFLTAKRSGPTALSQWALRARPRSPS